LTFLDIPGQLLQTDRSSELSGVQEIAVQCVIGIAVDMRGSWMEQRVSDWWTPEVDLQIDCSACPWIWRRHSPAETSSVNKTIEELKRLYLQCVSVGTALPQMCTLPQTACKTKCWYCHQSELQMYITVEPCWQFVWFTEQTVELCWQLMWFTEQTVELCWQFMWFTEQRNWKSLKERRDVFRLSSNSLFAWCLQTTLALATCRAS
jgi:hypothetical protein